MYFLEKCDIYICKCICTYVVHISQVGLVTSMYASLLSSTQSHDVCSYASTQNYDTPGTSPCMYCIIFYIKLCE